MRVVLDANIYVSALISDEGHPAQIIDRWLAGEFDVLLSQPIVNEVLRVTGYARIQKKYAKVKEKRHEFVGMVADQGIWVEPSEPLSVVTDDESDNRYVECAVAGNARYIVSGDRHLLELREYHGVIMIDPAAFVTLLETGNV